MMASKPSNPEHRVEIQPPEITASKGAARWHKILIVFGVLLFAISLLFLLLNSNGSYGEDSEDLVVFDASGPVKPSSFPSPSNTGEHICLTKGCIEAAGLLLQNMDPTVDPCEDFHEFACGRWNQAHKESYYEYRKAQLPIRIIGIDSQFFDEL
ncbi:unnamed protein product, partial [Mesorhabditis spiculigera]